MLNKIINQSELNHGYLSFGNGYILYSIIDFLGFHIFKKQPFKNKGIKKILFINLNKI